MQSVPHLSATSYQSWYDEKRIALSSSIDSTIKLLNELQDANSTWPLHYPCPKNLPTAELHNNGITSLPSTPELAVLRLDFRLGSLSHDKFVQKLGKDAIASMLQEKMRTCIRQLSALQERINDPLSKILVTGDVNAGKSTFCNALLRRRILPEDQQPCTAIFCEVMHATKNSGLEEVHATTPQHADDVFALRDLERVVTDARYTQCKVFVDDLRKADESLLSSDKEVVDIALIDAPGLNHDTTHTTAVFARQEEIDVVVFVVSATNHFTISAKEFIRAATAEKEYLFIVVNAFDTITNKERCKSGIMQQIQQLSPQTFKESCELVHFVSSNAVFTSNAEGQGVRQERVQDFERLERSLRKFVLEKRARSKLAPARTYLLNVLHDVNRLATATVETIQSELERASGAIEDIVPQLESRTQTVARAGIEIDTMIENTCLDVLNHSRSAIAQAITSAGDESQNYGVAYNGLFTAFQYAEQIRAAMLARISDSVSQCEDDARAYTAKGVNVITQIGILHGGASDAFEKLRFRPEVMFSRKRDALARQVNISIELQDFIDWPTLLWTDKFAGAGVAVTLATAVGGRLTDLYGWLDSVLMLTRIMDKNRLLRQLLIPGVLAAVITATLAHVLRGIPNAVPRHLSSKIAAQLSAIDYVHVNSARITDSVRRVLRVPAENMRVALDRSVRDLEHQRDQMNKLCDDSHFALKYFGNLVLASAAEAQIVEGIRLEPGSDD
ncbi:P-loop containing nucleoside triphosphate hydrolase protein [Colletotrichum caudatum]|nr:P-loop containing nucleoside triphosphate hydrolase protein [Colletotrichum caudatum]